MTTITRIDDKKIEENKTEFLELIQSITRENSQISELVDFLEKSDFFFAPASTRYHGAFKGGLCQHSLNVYNMLWKFIEDIFPSEPVRDEEGTVTGVKRTAPWSEDSIKIVALCHDFDKIGLYEPTSFNKKFYSEQGSRTDECGRYDWVSIPGYAVKDVESRYIFGTHGENSNNLVSFFIPLSDEESCAIINHHSKYDNPNLDITAIYNRYNLACLLHLADMAATYILERT